MAGTNSRCPFYRGVRLIEGSVKRELTKEWQGPTLGVRFTEVFVL